MIYAVSASLLERLHAGSAPPLPQTAWASVSIINALAHIFAVPIVFATARRLSGQSLVALLLCGLFAFSPQILDIDLERVDRLMILPLVAILHVSVLIIRGEAHVIPGVVLGVAMALVSATKISGFLFAVFPLSAAAILLGRRWHEAEIRRMVVGVMVSALVIGPPFLALLMIRYVLHAPLFPALLAGSYEAQMAWVRIGPMTPTFYYNIDLFLGHGLFFLAYVGMAVAALTGQALLRRDPSAIWLIGNLLLFSWLGTLTFKYSRGGYHLVPLYLYALAAMAAMLPRTLARRWPHAAHWTPALNVLALTVPVAVSLQAFVESARTALGRPAAIARTRDEPAQWIVSQFGQDARICMLGSSQWAGPRLAGKGVRVVTAPFDFPYLDAAGMAEFDPPSLEQLRYACDAVVFNNFHKELYPNTFRLEGHPEMAQRWESFYAGLAKEDPPRVFEAETPAYYVRRVEIYDLRGPLPPWPSQIDRPHPADGRITGHVDAVRRYPDGSVYIAGWAVDKTAKMPAVGIAVSDGTRILDTTGTATLRRPDVAAHFGIADYRRSGFSLCVPPNRLSRTLTPLHVLAVSSDGVAGDLAPTGVPIAEAGPGPLPEPCHPPGSEYER